MLTITRSEPGHSVPIRLKIKRYHINVSIKNQLTTTKIDQVFVNTNDFAVEGTYLFPVNDEILITNNVLHVDRKLVKGSLLSQSAA